jgi:hypothetical protein
MDGSSVMGFLGGFSKNANVLAIFCELRFAICGNIRTFAPF